MIKQLKKEWKYLLGLFFVISLIAFIYYLPAILSKTAYITGSDLRMQWYEFYYEFKNLIIQFIKEGKLPFYSWNLFLGNNFYASKAYYLIGDIYSYIGLFLSNNFFVMVEELSYLKELVAGFTFYLFLTSLDKKPMSKLICSIAYAFSAFSIYYSEQLVFQSFYSFIPLYLMGIELYLKDNKKLLFTLSCALLFATNYYLFYTLAALSPIYFTYRYFCLNKDRKYFIKSALILIIFFILGSLISSFIWLPGVIYILSGNRVASSYSILHDIVVYPNFIISFFAPNYIYLNRGNMFETWAYYNREICTWASTILIVLVPQIINLYDKRKKKLTIGLYAIFGVIAFFPILCMLLHGFSDPSFRWTFIIVIVNLMVISDVLDNFEQINFKLLKKTIIFNVLLLVACFIFGYLNSWQELSEYTKQITIILISFIVMFISYFLYKKRNIKILLIMIVVEMASSCLYFSYDNVKNNRTISNESIYRTIIQSYYGESADYLKSLDDDNEFYRVYVDQQGVYGTISYNLNILYNIKGVATYDSTLAPSFEKMKTYLSDRYQNDGLDWMIDITDYYLLRFLNTKYAITSKDFDMSLDYWELLDDNYYGGYKLFVMKDYKEFGSVYSNIMSYDDFLENYYSSEILNDYVIVDENDFDKISKYVSEANEETTNINYSGNRLSYEYTSDNDSFTVLSIPYDKGWKIYIDGEEVNYYDVNLGFIGFPIIEGQHEVTMVFIPEGLKEGCVISSLAAVGLIVYFLCEKTKKKQVSKNI